MNDSKKRSATGPASERLGFLERLLGEAGPSGFEGHAARVWRDEALNFTDRVWADKTGNSYAATGSGKPVLLMAGHIDEIGIQVTHLEKSGLLRFAAIGGWDPQVLVGQRVRIRTSKGEVPGVVGRKAIHLMEAAERKKVAKIKALWVDVGASSKEESLEMGLRVGDPGVIDARMVRLAGDRIASRAIDNRVGAFVVLEALRLIAESDPAPNGRAVAAATAQEEIGYGGGGARAGAYLAEPNAAIVVDVTHATDVPEVDKALVGEHELGGGPVLTRGSTTHPGVFDALAAAARDEDIPFTIQAAPLRTSTDADAIHLVRGGIPTGLVSIPNRYMHSPSEVVSTSDLFAAARLIAAFFVRLSEGKVIFDR